MSKPKVGKGVKARIRLITLSSALILSIVVAYGLIMVELLSILPYGLSIAVYLIATLLLPISITYIIQATYFNLKLKSYVAILIISFILSLIIWITIWIPVTRCPPYAECTAPLAPIGLLVIIWVMLFVIITIAFKLLLAIKKVVIK